MARSHGNSTLLFCCLTIQINSSCQRVEDDFGHDASPSIFTADTTVESSETDEPADSPSASATYFCDPANIKVCPIDKKCAPILNLNKIDRYECIADSPHLEPFDLCSVSYEGKDGCPNGYACSGGTGEFDNAYCQPLCSAQGDCPVGHQCRHHFSTEVRFCAEFCNPLAQNCPTGLSCLQSDQRFACRQHTKLDTAEPGSICADDSNTLCQEGLLCTPGSLLSGCVSAFCCASLCSLHETSICQSPYTCSPISELMSPELDNVGACMVPADFETPN